MKRHDHSPAYILQIRRQWRIVVPICGKLTPKICPAEFPSRASAEAWLHSDDGQREVDAFRGRSTFASSNSIAAVPSAAFYAITWEPS